jgi:hypothetical protein
MKKLHPFYCRFNDICQYVINVNYQCRRTTTTSAGPRQGEWLPRRPRSSQEGRHQVQSRAGVHCSGSDFLFFAAFFAASVR